MNRDDEIHAVLVEIRDAQRQALANQEKAIAAQQLAIERQSTHLRLYRLVVVLVVPLIAALGFVLYRLAAPHL
jgi:type VI protein secretion system component VasF